MKKFKFDIFKTFDKFTSDSMSLLRDVIVNFVLIESENFFLNKSKMDANIYDEKIVQVNIYQNNKLYNFLTNSWNRKRTKVKNENK